MSRAAVQEPGLAKFKVVQTNIINESTETRSRNIKSRRKIKGKREFWRLPLSLRLDIFDTQIPTPMSTTQGCPKTPGILTSGLSGSSNTIPRDPIGVFDHFTTPTQGRVHTSSWCRQCARHGQVLQKSLVCPHYFQRLSSRPLLRADRTSKCSSPVV